MKGDTRTGSSGGLPSGTVTFLFTDIEGSTGRAGELGDERWAAVLAVHHELLRRAFDAHSGVVIGTEGDAFFVVFERASDAAAAALAGQRALETHDWSIRLRVRMGLHTGEALVRDGDYVGHEVHRAKRIADAGHGGQVILSQTTADLVREALPDGAWIVDLGLHRLKDMAETQILHQLTSDGLQEEPERTLLRRLSVFAGDFDLAAAEEVCGDEVLPAADVVDRLGSLVTKSLLTTVDTPAAVRYRLLETVRTYASGKLRDAGEADTVRARHRDRYLSWLEAIPDAEAYAGTTSLAAISRELDNLRAAIDLCVVEDRPDLLGRMATQMAGLFGHIGMPDEGHRWLSIALADPDRLDPRLRARCYVVLSQVTMMTTEPGAVDTARRAVDLAGDRDPEALAQYAFVLSVQAAITQDPELVRECRECAGRAIQLADDLEPVWQVRMRIRAAWVELDLGDVARARELFDGAAAVCPEGFDSLMSSALSGVAVTSHVLGHHEDAARAARAALRYREAEASPDLFAEGAPAIAAGGDVELARELLREALLRSRRGGVPIAVNANLVLCGVVECLVGRWDRASRLLAAARHLGGAAGLPVPFRSPEVYTWYHHYLPLVREALGPEDARRGRDEGRAMSEDEAITYALEGLESGRSAPT